MARKRNTETTMAEFQKEAAISLQLDNENPQVTTFDTFAVGMVYKDNKWNLVKVPINSETLLTGSPEIVAKESEKLEIEHRFKILVGEELM